MKTIPELILDLQRAKTPSRVLDIAIALSIGYSRSVTYVKGESGKKDRKVTYLYPTKDTEVSIPHFTSTIEAAKALSETISPGCAGGFTWGDRGFAARIEEGPVFSGATPALALCAAALDLKYRSFETD